MGGLLSKKEKKPSLPPITEQDQAILQLKTQRDKMKQQIKRKEKCIEKERLLAKQLLADGRKDRALLLLKKKRVQENFIMQTLGQLDKIERMVQDVEFAVIQARVVEGLRQGNEALKRMNQLFDVDEIDKIMEETKEAADYQQEISSMISGQLSSSDEAECEEELASLLAAHAQPLPELPDAPTEALPEREQEKAKEKGQKERVLVEA